MGKTIADRIKELTAKQEKQNKKAEAKKALEKARADYKKLTSKK